MLVFERRSDKRLILHSPVEIVGVDDSGFQFVEQTRLEDFSDLGCRFSMRNVVRRGAVLRLELLGPNGETLPEEYPRLFVALWVRRKGDRQIVGARCLLEDDLTAAGSPRP